MTGGGGVGPAQLLDKGRGIVMVVGSDHKSCKPNAKTNPLNRSLADSRLFLSGEPGAIGGGGSRLTPESSATRVNASTERFLTSDKGGFQREKWLKLKMLHVALQITNLMF